MSDDERQPSDPATPYALFARELHDLKQPLSLIRIMAQDLRLDVSRGRLEVASVPQSMRTIELAVDQLTARLDELGSLAKGTDVEDGS